MAGSQLKRLKASLRDQGIVGPQQSKKQKKQRAQDPQVAEKRLQRAEALTSIREQYNPFQFKTNARGPKFAVTTLHPANDKTNNGSIAGRPGVARSRAEERRRNTLLVEMQQRNRVGGLNDRRFGEADPNMTYEQKMAERFATEMRRSHKKSIFDLEDDDEPAEGLTHLGKPLSVADRLAARVAAGKEEEMRDDFDAADLPSGEESDTSEFARKRLKRLRPVGEGEGDEEEGEEGDAADQPGRKRTQKEIFEEVIAKSKMHKYERQAVKEADTELREELDKELPELQALLLPLSKVGLNAAPTSDKAALEKEYDRQVRELARDNRAAPTERTKTDEEMVKEHAERLQKLESDRQRRMRGEILEEEEEEEEKEGDDQAAADMDVEDDEFGLGKGVGVRMRPSQLVLDDEDEFLLEDDLVASGSDMDELDSDVFSDEGDEEGVDEDADEDEEDDEFIKGLLTEAERLNPAFKDPVKSKGNDADGVPYVLPCPQDHAELLDAFANIELSKLSVAVQRIRALFHPRLDAHNKEKLGKFARALIQHISFLAKQPSAEPKPELFPALEGLIRHVHSLAKTHPLEVASEYRLRIEEMGKQRPLALDTGDLAVLTAVGSTFPTSDHWHEVATPAQLTIGRYLGQKVPESLADYATGTYLSILAVHFQRLSKRYMPELLNFTLNTLCALSPEKPPARTGFFPVHAPPAGIRIKDDVSAATVRKLDFSDCRPASSSPSSAASSPNSLKVSLLDTTASILREAAQILSHHPAFPETFSPAQTLLTHILASSSSSSPQSSSALPPTLISNLKESNTLLTRLIRIAHLARRPLELHHHRPRPIPSYVPKLADGDGRFDPRKHYDPDRERAALAKLTAEHKRERKGALRELRRDAAFVARERLRQKRERDSAYDAKYKRLVAEIQGEEGHAKKEYEREKVARKRKR